MALDCGAVVVADAGLVGRSADLNVKWVDQARDRVP